MKDKYRIDFGFLNILLPLLIIAVLVSMLVPRQAVRAAEPTRVERLQDGIRAHSLRVYKALNTTLEMDDAATHAAVVTVYGPDCLSARVTSPYVKYGWKSEPTLNACTIAVNGNEFVVTAIGNQSSNNFISINGQ